MHLVPLPGLLLLLASVATTATSAAAAAAATKPATSAATAFTSESTATIPVQGSPRWKLRIGQRRPCTPSAGGRLQRLLQRMRNRLWLRCLALYYELARVRACVASAIGRHISERPGSQHRRHARASTLATESIPATAAAAPASATTPASTAVVRPGRHVLDHPRATRGLLSEREHSSLD